MNSIKTNEDSTKPYAFTYRYQRYKKGQIGEEEDYDIVINHLERKGIQVTEHYLEVSEKQPHLHMHGIFYATPNKVYPSSLYIAGFHYKVEELYNKEGWQRYIKKAQKQPLLRQVAIKHDVVKFSHDDITDDDMDDVEIKPPTRNLFKVKTT